MNFSCFVTESALTPNTKAFFEKAKLFKSKGDIEATKSILNELIEIDSGYYRAYELLMDLEISASNLDNAVSYANKALKASPDAYTILARLASVYNEKLDYNKAKDNAKLNQNDLKEIYIKSMSGELFK